MYTANKQNRKQAGSEHAVARWQRATGAIGGPNAPTPYRNIGGPLTGTILQSLLLGGAGYGVGRLGSWLLDRNNKYNHKKVGLLAGLAAALGGGVLPNLPELKYNWDMVKHLQGKDRLRAAEVMNLSPNQRINNMGLEHVGPGYEAMWAQTPDWENANQFSAPPGREIPVEIFDIEPTVRGGDKWKRSSYALGEKAAEIKLERGLNQPTPMPAIPGIGHSRAFWRRRLISAALLAGVLGIRHMLKRKKNKDEDESWFKHNHSEKAAEIKLDMNLGVAGGVGPQFDTFLPPNRHGFGFPANYTKSQIENDPYMSPIAKARAVSLIDEASRGKSGLIGWDDVGRAGIGLGIGYAGGALVGKVMDGIFGGLSRKVHTRLRQAGMVAGLLKATGVLR